MPFLQQFCTHIKATFSIQDKNIFHKGTRLLLLLAQLQQLLHRSFFFFLSNGPYAGFIYIEKAGNDSCRPQSMAHMKHFNFFLYCHFFSLFLGSTSSIAGGTSYGSPGVIQGLWYCTKHDEKYMRTMRDHFLLQYKIYWTNRSRRDDWSYMAF